jgi:REP element-mobilizing transposase RayT
MSRKYKFGDSSKLYFISFAVVYWIDLFIRKEYKDVMLESWRFCQTEKELEIYGWCIMSSHVHMIIGSRGRALEKTVGEMKSFTSRALRKAISEHDRESRREWMMSMMEVAGMGNSNNGDWQLWQQNNKPLEILTGAMFYQKLNYIHRNPVEAGFVENEEDYLYSSARDFYGKAGLIELCYVV